MRANVLNGNGRALPASPKLSFLPPLPLELAGLDLSTPSLSRFFSMLLGVEDVLSFACAVVASAGFPDIVTLAC